MGPADATRRRKFRDAAAVVLVRGHGAELEVFWAKRSDAVAFMPGFHAFIGGTVMAEDAEVPMDGVPEGPERLLRVCAVREAFEEAGVLIGLEEPALPGVLSEARGELLAGEARFEDLARDHGWRFRGDALPFAGRWMTPPFSAARFDTMFYLARLPEGQEASVRVGELAHGEWIRPAEAIARWKSGDVSFAAPTLHTLEELMEGEERLAERLSSAPERSLIPVRRIELKWGIVLHPMKTSPLPPSTHTNCYLVGTSEMAMIDPASDDPEDLEALFTLIGRLEADGRKLKMILVTHDHPDHVGGLKKIRKHFGVPVAAHPLAAAHVHADVEIDDGAVIELGPAGEWNLRAIHTPGHARGHLCFVHERTRSLFTGDHVIGGKGTVIVDPPEGDMAAYVQALERLATEPVETIFPGHGSPQGAALRRIRALIKHRREREQRVIAALDEDPRPLSELVERAYADTPPELWRYAERSLLAHLLDLEGRGAAVREGERWRAPGAAG